MNERRSIFHILNIKGLTLTSYLLLAGLAWIYIWLRAALVPFQSDEAATLFMYVQPGNFLPPNAQPDANNHILNSFLTWISFHLFGSSPLSLRLPNVMVAPIYLYFIYMLSGLIMRPLPKWGFILLSIGTHFLIEFFSYSRGYGLSLAFLAGSLYYTILLFKKPKLRFVILATLSVSLAAFANLNLIFTAMAIFSILLFRLLTGYKHLSKKMVISGLLAVIIVGGLTCYYLVGFSFQIREFAGFYYGSPDGFMKVTVTSLCAMTTGQSGADCPAWIVSLWFIAVFLTMFQLVKKFRSHQSEPSAIFIILILINWIGALMLNRYFQVNFQEDRAAIHLIPVFYGMIFFGIDRLYPLIKQAAYLVAVPFLIIPAFTITQFNVNRSVYGNSLQVPADFYDFISEEYEGKDFPPVVSSYQGRRQQWAYMNYRAGGNLNPLFPYDFPNKSADYLIHELPLPGSLTGHFETVLTNMNTRTGLFRNTRTPDFSLYKANVQVKSDGTSNLYHNLLLLGTDTLGGFDMLLEIDLLVVSPEKPFQAAVVVELFDENRKNLVYEAIDLDQLRPAWNNPEEHFRHVFLINDIPHESTSLLIYLWNKKKAGINELSGQVNVKLAPGSM